MERLVLILTAASFLLDFAAGATSGIDSYRLVLGFGRYQLHTEQRTYDEAKATCAKEEARLAVPTSRVVQDTMIELLLSKNIPFAYIGVNDRKNEGTMVTVKGELYSEVGYSQFAHGEPNDFNGNEDCVYILSSGQLNDTPCSDTVAFFCEKIRMVPHDPY